jgi:ribosome-associated toxin RatA of RatAB toxin-antitoxin module
MQMESLVAYTSHQVRSVIIAVTHYPDFLPGCAWVHILDQGSSHLVARMHLSMGLAVTTRMHWTDCAVFLENPFVRGQWLLAPWSDGTKVSLHLEWLGVGPLAKLVQGLWPRYAPVMQRAFEGQLHAQYKIIN